VVFKALETKASCSERKMIDLTYEVNKPDPSDACTHGSSDACSIYSNKLFHRYTAREISNEKEINISLL
jgi:hypothetical protein